MLKLLRNNTKIIIWTMVLAFVLWGAFSVSTQMSSGTNYAGKVFGKNISFQEYNRFYKAAQIFTFAEKPVEDPNLLRTYAWQALTFAREAKNRGLEATNEEVREEVLKLLSKQQIAVEAYPDWVETTLRQTPAEFESQVRAILMIQKLMASLLESETIAPPSPDEAKKQFLKEKNQISLEFISFPNLEEANRFREKVKSAEDWNKEAAAKPEAFKKTGLIAEDFTSVLFPLPEAEAGSLKNLEKGAISAPLTIGSQFNVFYAADKTSVTEQDFESQKEAYLEQLTAQKKNLALVQKTQEILTRAKLQEFKPEASSS